MTATTTEPETLPLEIESGDYDVVISVQTTRNSSVAAGKAVKETKSYLINDTYTDTELRALLYKLQPVSAP